jgi:dTDP-4-amino-4,6-dideoxygalactose transaminase
MKQIHMLDLRLQYEYMKVEIDDAIRKCLEHQKWIFGPEIKELEDAVAAYLKVKNCIGVSSGTEALVLSLRALAIKRNGREFFEKRDEIITTPFTFTATGDAVLRSGAKPVFVDIDPQTFNIDVEKVKGYLGKNSSKVVGIIPVHLYGQACRMDAIMDLAGKYGIFVVEDIAQAFGAGCGGRKLGSIGDCGAFSFFPSKNLGGFGDGGMISTDDDDMAEMIRMLIKHGGKDKYNVDHIGYNARLDTLQAAVLLAKFKFIDEFNSRRRKIAEIYNRELACIDEIALPVNVANGHSSEEDNHVFHQYTIRLKKGDRSAFQEYLKKKGIATMVYYPFPLHKMKVFGNGSSKSYGGLEHSERASSSVVSLPLEPLQDNETTGKVAEAIKEYYGNSFL